MTSQLHGLGSTNFSSDRSVLSGKSNFLLPKKMPWALNRYSWMNHATSASERTVAAAYEDVVTRLLFHRCSPDPVAVLFLVQHDQPESHSSSGRTSIDPRRAAGIFAAIRMASFRSLASIRWNAPNRSLAPAAAPLEMKTEPSRT